MRLDPLIRTCLVLTICSLAQSAVPDPVIPSTVEELRSAIQEELEEVGHGSAGIALVSKDRTIWAAGIGIADPETHREADEDSYWRLGSLSKSFVGLAALILEGRGELRLTDPVSELVPEIAIGNRWAIEAPVRLVHLLEHTAGLDELHLKDYASNDPKPLSLLQGLNHIRDSLYCRWPPGLHFSYCNSGPAVAAYIVQKLSGRPFEEFLAAEILEPLKMTGAGLLPTADLGARLATGYDVDGRPLPYRHIVVRPSGALSASPTQMANFVRMLLNRGQLDGRRLVSRESIARLERSETTRSSSLLPRTGYGLGNSWNSSHGFVFRGHTGSNRGYRARYAYLPDQGLGYCLMIAVGNDDLALRIDHLVSGYLVRNLERPTVPVIDEMPSDIDEWTGYYRPVTPRNESRRYVERLGGVRRIAVTGDDLVVLDLSGHSIEFHPSDSRAFRRESQPAATLALVQASEGTKYVQGELGNLRKVSAAVIWCERAVAGIAGLLMLSSPLWALFWVPLRRLGKHRGRSVAVRLWPLLSVMTILFSAALLGMPGGGGYARLADQFGRPSLPAFSFVVLSWAFVLLAVQGLSYALRIGPSLVGRFARLHSIAVSSACLVVAAYLLFYRAIGFPTWQ